MYGVSDQFRQAVIYGGKYIVRVDLFRSGALIVSDIRIDGGSVTRDLSATFRATCTVNVVDESLIPTSASSWLAPYGSELKIWAGYDLPSGEELVPLGVFRITDCSTSRSGGGITVNGVDRSRSVSRARFDPNYTVSPASNYSDAIYDLIEDRIGPVTFRGVNTTRTTPLLDFRGDDDPWEAALDMADSIGCDLYFDVDGALVLSQKLDPIEIAAVWTFDGGEENISMTLDNSFTDEPGWNGVRVTGEPTDGPPVTVTVYDEDTSSPTYSGGAYGRVPRLYTSPFIATEDQATEVANGFLRRERGGTQQLSMTSYVNPAIREGDAVRVVDDILGLHGVEILERVMTPLTAAEDQRLDTRRRQTV